jgi:hypothetical protein
MSQFLKIGGVVSNFFPHHLIKLSEKKNELVVVVVDQLIPFHKPNIVKA